jgi:hypothetical protein
VIEGMHVIKGTHFNQKTSHFIGATVDTLLLLEETAHIFQTRYSTDTPRRGVTRRSASSRDWTVGCVTWRGTGHRGRGRAWVMSKFPMSGNE